MKYEWYDAASFVRDFFENNSSWLIIVFVITPSVILPFTYSQRRASFFSLVLFFSLSFQSALFLFFLRNLPRIHATTLKITATSENEEKGNITIGRVYAQEGKLYVVPSPHNVWAHKSCMWARTRHGMLGSWPQLNKRWQDTGTRNEITS